MLIIKNSDKRKNDVTVFGISFPEDLGNATINLALMRFLWI